MNNFLPIASGYRIWLGISLLVLGAFSLGACSSVELLNATIPETGYVRKVDIAYGELSRQKLDVYRPCSGTKVNEAVAPVIIFFYGGDWQYGSKSDYLFVAQALTSRGFVVVMPDYRLYPQVVFPAFVQDGALAVRWAKDHAREFGGNPEHMFVMGHSAGAHIAAMLTFDAQYLKAVGLDRDTIKAAVLMSGPYSFVPTGIRRHIFSMKIGRYLPDENTQPMMFVDQNDPPVLLIQGLRDKIVDPSNTRQLVTRINERGGQVQTLYEADRGHVGVVLSLAQGFHWLAPTLDALTQFFRQYE